LNGAELALHITTVGGDAGPVFGAIRASRATAVFFTELADAVMVEAHARSLGLSVPGDLSIIVLGSHIRPAQSGTRFTTFSIPREEMARRAVAMLAARIEAGDAGGQTLLNCETVEGETLAALKRVRAA
jgi:DNA-binding LacI/PurR family transcriptional regulator